MGAKRSPSSSSLRFHISHHQACSIGTTRALVAAVGRPVAPLVDVTHQRALARRADRGAVAPDRRDQQHA
eukprot:5569603-Pyramimonas_sp.AAC.1